MLVWLLPLALAALTGCPPRKAPVQEGPPPAVRPLAEQIAAVNDNLAGITRTLSGGGISVSTRIHEDGKEHRYDLDGWIRFLPPRFLYFDFSHLGMTSAVHIGSNNDMFWVWVRPEQNRLWWGRWADLQPADTSQLPLAPDMILAAMGLAPLPTTEAGLAGPRAEASDHRYTKLRYYAGGQKGPWLQREYWLDRYPPFLPRVVIFYEPGQKIKMLANLDDYQPVAESAVYIARDVRMTWPKENDSLHIRLGKLRFDEGITAESPAFQLIKERVPIKPDRWERVTEEGEVDEGADAMTAPVTAAAASAPAADTEPATSTQSTASTKPAPAAAPVTSDNEALPEVPAAQACEPVTAEPDRAPSVAPTTQPASTAPASRPTGLVKYQDGVFIDWGSRQVLLAGQVVLREGDLELFACSPNTKEHESIVCVMCQPRHMFEALGLIGLEPGRPPLYDNRAQSVVPATGDRLDIRVRWTEGNTVRTVPIWQWLWNRQENRPAGRVEWVFSGSMPTQDGYLLADLDGTIITVVDFESALVSVPASHTSANEDLWLRANTAQIPPVGTAVTVIVRAAESRLTFRLDGLGGLYVNGRQSTLRQAIEAARRQLGATGPGDGASQVEAVLEYDPGIADIQVEQLVMGLRQAGLSDLAVRPARPAQAVAEASGSGSATRDATADLATFAPLEQQGAAVLQVLSDLGRQLPSAMDSLTKSWQTKYIHISERATAAGRAAAGAARALEAMQGPAGQAPQQEP